MKDTKIRPHWKMIALDASEHFDCEDASNIVGRIADCYIYNKNSITHCCECEPSYDLIWIKTVVEKGHSEDPIIQEKIDDIEATLNQEQAWVSTYRQCRHIDRLPQMTLVDFNTISDDKWQDIIAEISEDGDILESDWNWEKYICDQYRPDEKEPPLPWE